MSFERDGYRWEGAFTSADSLESRAGIYMVWCRSGDTWTALDVGESHNVQERVRYHDRADQWRRACRGALHFAAHYTPHLQATGRREIEKRIRTLENPTCGDR